jgi:tetratricopeptide (TPR) repeat protein
MTLADVQNLVARGRYIEAFCRAVTAACAEGVTDQERVELHLLAARACGPGLHQYREAAEQAVQAVELAARASLHDELQRARATAGEAFRRFGDMPRAEDYLTAFLGDDHGSQAEKRLRGTCLYNLGLVHTYRRNWDDALRLFVESVEAFTAAGMLVHAIAPYQMMAWTYLLTERTELAEEPLRASSTIIPSGTEEDRSYQIALEARYALQAGNAEAALAMCREILVPTRPGVLPTHKAEAGMIMAEAKLQAGKLAEAEASARFAVECAEKSLVPHVINRANEVLRQVLSRLE